MKSVSSLLIAFCFCLTAYSQNKILLSKAKVHVGNGQVIEQGYVGIENNKIILVKNALTTTINESEWDTIINLKNHHLYPGFFAPNSTLGLTEVDAVRSTRDFNEVGDLNPHIRALIAYNVESRIIKTVRTNGVLFSQATPRGGIISGTSSVMKLDGWNWEDAVVREDDGIHLNWPKTLQGGGWWAEPKPKKANEKYDKQVRVVTDFMAASKAYSKNSKNADFDARYEAMKAVFNGEKRVYIHADELKALIDIIEFAQEFKLKFPVIVGGYDSYMITDQLKDAEIPVMLTRLHSLPSAEDDPVDLVYRLPKLLSDRGVKFCLENSGSMEAMNARNIPFLAGTAMSYGLTEEEAIKSVTLSTAEILGLGDKYGSIEKGKHASLFVSKGNALDMKSNDVKLILIEGEFVPLDNHQLDLYKKYKAKYEE